MCVCVFAAHPLGWLVWEAWHRLTLADMWEQVCHVDSGVRIDHPDLVANVAMGWNLVPPGQVSWQPRS